ncbi:hypothetical protein F2Q68_00013620 [Brassica cretica]|uniref:Sulfotransferase n=1 Tax=Brassica cretica TaxID=69181 RepID=A0A8S9HCD1_BRACR|nr:hypothetical protein F2Q68_00013620 [Brassica cretica]
MGSLKRKGKVGDWENYLTPEMVARIDERASSRRGKEKGALKAPTVYEELKRHHSPKNHNPNSLANPRDNYPAARRGSHNRGCRRSEKGAEDCCLQLTNPEDRPAVYANSAYFRKGKVGDWENYLTPEMVARIDGLMEEKFRGTGFLASSP